MLNVFVCKLITSILQNNAKKVNNGNSIIISNTFTQVVSRILSLLYWVYKLTTEAPHSTQVLIRNKLRDE
jgi:hypothetical protein